MFTAVYGNVTLGVAGEPRQYIADQLFAKADVIRSMHERVQLCQDPQTGALVSEESTTFSESTVTQSFPQLVAVRRWTASSG